MACAACIVLLGGANLFIALGRDAIENFDEGRYGVSAYEMLRSHRWMVPTYAGETEYWNLKPPLGYWGMAASYAVFGPGKFALRFLSASCCLGGIMVTMHFARHRLGRNVALLAGSILATAFPYIDRHSGRSGDLDAQLTLMTTIAFLALEWRWPSRFRAIMVGLMIALGFLLKAFAILPSLLVVAVHQGFAGTRSRIPLKYALLAGLIPIVLICAWVAARVHSEGSWRFITTMINEDLCQRASSSLDGRCYRTFFYVRALLGRFWPWPMIVLLQPIMMFARRWQEQPNSAGPQRDRLVLAMWGWLLIPLILFSVARTQCFWYINPLYPPLALLSGLTLVMLCQRFTHGAIIAACYAIIALGCGQGEVRIIKEIIEDNQPDRQDFLAAVAADAAYHGREICCNFTLDHAERFLLEVAGEMKIREQAEEREARPGELFLCSRDETGNCCLPVDLEVVASNGYYKIYRRPAGTVPVTIP